ncbi:fungal hydrophobin [Mycena epipterygia]|nr:fungal hydrophobin [Mycena epipterygia]
MLFRPPTLFIIITSALARNTRAAGCPDGGPIQCCNSVDEAGNLAAVLGTFGVTVDDLTSLVGISCSPILVIGTGGSACSASVVCCTGPVVVSSMD